MGMYDILMLVIFGGAVLFGAWKGLAWQVASLAAIVVSYIVAINFREPLGQLLQTEPPWNNFLAMLILFLGTSLIIWMIFGRVKASIKKMHLAGFDRQAGALLGAVKGALLCMVVTMFAVTLFGETTTQAVFNSRSGGYITRGINQLTAVVPPEIHDVLNPYVDRFNQALESKGFTPNGQLVNQPDVGDPIYGGQPNTGQQPNQPQYGQFNPYRQTSSEQNYQNYQGQWQQPNQNQNSGYGGQDNQNQQQPIYQNSNSGQSQQPSSQWGQGTTITQGQDGWPKLQVDTRDLLNAGADAAREAARKFLEPEPSDGSNR